MMDRSSLLASRIYHHGRSLIYNTMFKFVDRKVCSSWIILVDAVVHIINDYECRRSHPPWTRGKMYNSRQ